MPAVIDDAVAVGHDARRSRLRAAPHERLAMLTGADRNAAPGVIDQVDLDARQLRIALDEMPAQQHAERLGLADALARRQRVDGIFHRVGRQHVAIVAVRIGCVVARPRTRWRR